MPQSDQSRIEYVGSLIAAYWETHPDAADAVEGVVWWIPELSLEPKSRIRTALELLVVRGLARKRQAPDGSVIYWARQQE